MYLRRSLGCTRSSELQVHVPDLSVTLKFEDPFGELEARRKAACSAEADDQALWKIIEAEKAVVGKIMTRCMELLEETPEWANILEAWVKDEKMGLAQKRYDRLEWVHGANEQRMHGTIAMQKTHDLELRPKHLYPTTVKSEDGGTEEDPSPMERFLVCLSQDYDSDLESTCSDEEVTGGGRPESKSKFSLRPGYRIFLRISHGFPTRSGKEFQLSPIDTNVMRLISHLFCQVSERRPARSIC